MLKYAIGQSVPRTEDPRLLKGRGRYVDDVSMPHQTHAFMLRSPHAHAEIRSIDASAALKAPGVVAVLTGADYAADGLGNIGGGANLKRRDGSPMYRPPRPCLTKDRVRHLGQVVAVVIAETLADARDAAELVDIDYAVLPSFVDAEKARNMPAIWDACPDNESFVFRAGNKAATDAAIAKAAHVISHRFVISRINANTMEPRATLAYYDEGEGKYTIHAGIQRPFANRSSIAKNILKIPENRLRIVTGDMGGSFGMKGALYPETILAAWAAKRVGRPVKWRADRSEGFISDDHCRDNITTGELALDAEGNFLALRVHTIANLGGYMSSGGFGPPTNNIGGLVGVYRIAAAHVEVSAVFTNTQPTSAYRGAGRPEASYVIESLIDMAAQKLKISPLDIRKRNLIPPSAMPYKTALVYTYDCGEFETLIDKTLKKADYAGYEARRKQSEANGKLRGVGLSCTIEVASKPQTGESAEVRFDPSGSVTLLVGSTPHGQGHETVYKQIMCSALGLSPEAVRLVEGDTEQLAIGTGTGGSRTAAIGGTAVHIVSGKVIDKTRKIAAHLMETAVEDVVFENGEFKVAGTDRKVSFVDTVKAAFDPAKLPEGAELGLQEFTTYLPDEANFPNSCHICEVEISPETGEVRLDRYTVVDDCGVELNPLLVKGQVHGGIAQGAGQALMEQMVYDGSSGQLLSGSFMDYAMPRADDFCYMDVSDHPVPTKTNPLGVKGVGESGTVGALAVVMNAVNNAIAPLGAARLEMPTTPERVWRAIQQAKGS